MDSKTIFRVRIDKVCVCSKTSATFLKHKSHFFRNLGLSLDFFEAKKREESEEIIVHPPEKRYFLVTIEREKEVSRRPVFIPVTWNEGSAYDDQVPFTVGSNQYISSMPAS